MLRPNRDLPAERTIGARQLLGILFLAMAAMVYISYLYAVRTEKSRMRAAGSAPAAVQQNEAPASEAGQNPSQPSTIK